MRLEWGDPPDPPPGIGERGSERTEDELDALEADRRVHAAQDEGRDG